MFWFVPFSTLTLLWSLMFVKDVVPVVTLICFIITLCKYLAISVSPCHICSSTCHASLDLNFTRKIKKITNALLLLLIINILPLFCLPSSNISIWPSVLLIFYLCLIRKLKQIQINISCFPLDILCFVVTVKVGMLKGSDYKTSLDIYFCRKYVVCISCKQTRMQECRQWLSLIPKLN